MMRFEWRVDEDGAISFSGQVDQAVLRELQLDAVGQAAMRRSVDTPADMLLVLETVFRLAGPQSGGRTLEGIMAANLQR